MKVMRGYLLLTHGAAHNISLATHPAARQQLANLRVTSRRFDAELKLVFDYARKHRSLSELPNLQTMLKASREAGSGGVVIDDLGRLFRHVPDAARKVFLDELLEAGGRIFGVRQELRLDSAPKRVLAVLLSGGAAGRFILDRPPTKPRSKQALVNQTVDAGIASERVRRQVADDHALRVSQLRDELLRFVSGTVTLQELCDHANERGLTTSRGNPWTPSGASRALKRIEKKRAEDERDVTMADRARARRASR